MIPPHHFLREVPEINRVWDAGGRCYISVDCFPFNPCGSHVLLNCRSPGSAKLLNDEGLYTADALSSAKWAPFIALGGASRKEG